MGEGNDSDIALARLAVATAELNYTFSRYNEGNASLARTLYYSTYWNRNKTQYFATEYVEFRLMNLSRIEGLLSALSSVQNVSVNSASSQLSAEQEGSLINSALRNALANATSQAGAISGGKHLYLTNITVNSYYVYPLAAAGALAGQTATPEFFNGMKEVVESITARFSYR